MDALDVALIEALEQHPRAGDLELSRRTNVARATVQTRLRRLQDSGVIASWAPRIDVAAAGHPVHAFVTLEIAQGALTSVEQALTAIPQVVEAYVTTGSADVLCRVATASHAELQDTLVALNDTPVVVRSTSVVVLSELIAPRVLPLLSSGPAAARPSRSPAHRAE